MKANKDDVIYVAVDMQGGLCDRIMLGRKGVVANANASISAWKFNAPDDEDIMQLQEIKGETDKDFANALQILFTDNFNVLTLHKDGPIVLEDTVIGYHVINAVPSNNITVINVTQIDFDENGVYKIY